MIDKELMERFDAKWAKDDLSGCWLWTASCAGKGYGQIRLPGQRGRRPEYAHRVSYMIYKGAIPEGRQVCHTCDNPKCVNPEHLFVGTSQTNHDDMVAKGRGRGGSFKGETNPSAKLKETDVLEMRKLLDAGLSQRRIGKIYGVSGVLVSLIANGKLWSHIQTAHKAVSGLTWKHRLVEDISDAESR